MGGRASARVRTPSQGVAESLTGRRGHDSRGARGGRTSQAHSPPPPPRLFTSGGRAPGCLSRNGEAIGSGAQERVCWLCFCFALL